MSLGDGSSDDEAKWEEQQIKKAVKLSQVTHAFLTIGNCFLLIGKRACLEYSVSLSCPLIRDDFRTFFPNSSGKDD